MIMGTSMIFDQFHCFFTDLSVVVLDFDLFVQMQSLLQPGSGCSSELERDGGDDPGRIISSYMVMMMVMVVGRYVCVLI